MNVVLTGIEGLDEILNGGFPKGRIILVTGGPGTGKTVFAIQYLYYGAAFLNEKGIFISLEEPVKKIKENMVNFGFNLEEQIKTGKLSFVELTPIQFTTIKPSGLIHLIREKVTPEVKRLVIDPLTTIMLQEKDVYQQRLDLMRLFKTLSELNCTTIVTSEAHYAMLKRRFHAEEFLADGVVILHKIILKGRVVQALQVEKMRGVPHDTQLRPYKITEKGMVVYPKERVIELE